MYSYIKQYINKNNILAYWDTPSQHKFEFFFIKYVLLDFLSKQSISQRHKTAQKGFLIPNLRTADKILDRQLLFQKLLIFCCFMNPTIWKYEIAFIYFCNCIYNSFFSFRGTKPQLSLNLSVTFRTYLQNWN